MIGLWVCFENKTERSSDQLDKHMKERGESRRTPKCLAQTTGAVKEGFTLPEMERRRKEQAWHGCGSGLPSGLLGRAFWERRIWAVLPSRCLLDIEAKTDR